jgi:hypothetical protein
MLFDCFDLLFIIFDLFNEWIRLRGNLLPLDLFSVVSDFEFFWIWIFVIHDPKIKHPKRLPPPYQLMFLKHHTLKRGCLLLFKKITFLKSIGCPNIYFLPYWSWGAMSWIPWCFFTSPKGTWSNKRFLAGGFGWRRGHRWIPKSLVWESCNSLRKPPSRKRRSSSVLAAKWRR